MKLAECGENIMEIKKTDKGWEYHGIIFSDEKSARKTKEFEENSHDEAISIFVGSEDSKFQIEYEEKEQETFGKFIALILKHQMISLKQLAMQMAVSEQSIYAWMRGETIPTAKNLSQLMEIAKCKPESIVNALSFNFENSKRKLESELRELSKKKNERQPKKQINF